MTIHVGLLRAVNLAGHNRVAMADLQKLLVGLGMQDVRTLLQSGNVVFRSEISSTTKLERLLEESAEKRLGLETAFMVRSAKELKAAVADNPFREEAERDPSHLLLLFLKSPVERAAVTALQNAIKGREVVKAKGQHAYVVYPDGIGESRLTSALIEGKLGTRATGRNWNTVLKLRALSEPA